MTRAAFRRRSLIATAAGAAAWLAGLPAGGSAAGERSLRALCPELDCPPSIGAACLRALPAREQSSQSLIESIFSSLPPEARRATSTRTLARLLSTQIRNDFRDGAIVTADGWMLARTEARLYGLTARIAGVGTSAG